MTDNDHGNDADFNASGLDDRSDGGAPSESQLPPPPGDGQMTGYQPGFGNQPGYPPSPGYQAGPGYPPPPGSWAAGAPSAGRAWAWNAATILIVVGLALSVLGAMLPWASVTSMFGTISKNGMEGDGILTLFLGGAAGLLGIFGWLKAKKGLLIGSIVCGVLVALIAVIDIADVNRVAGDAEGIAEVSVGFGLYLTLLAGVASIVGAAIALKDR